MDAFYEFGIQINLYLQALGEWLYTPMRLLSYLAEEYFFLLLIPVLFWSVNFEWGLRLGVYVMFSGAVNTVLKLVFHTPRPFWYDSQVEALVKEGSFGVPSGHSQNAVVLFGTLAAWINKTWAWVVAVLIMLLVGVSRMYLGAHFIQDVLAGWLVGALLLWALFRYEKSFLGWFLEFTPVVQVVIALAGSLLLILLAGLINAVSSGLALPDAWQQNFNLALPDEPFNPHALTGTITYAAVLFGLAAGAVWLRARGGYFAGGQLWKRIVRVLIGLAGAGVLYVAGSFLPGEDDLVGYAMRFVRYGLLGFWSGGLAPVIFIGLKLAGKKGI